MTNRKIIGGLDRSKGGKGIIVVLLLTVIFILQLFGIIFNFYDALSSDDPIKLIFALVSLLEMIDILASDQIIIWLILSGFGIITSILGAR